MFLSIRHLKYSDTLRELGLPSLQNRRATADLIEVYTLSNGIDKSDKIRYSKVNPTKELEVIAKNYLSINSDMDLRKHFFSQRVIDDWNGLSENVISSDTISQFKNRLNKYWKDKPGKFEDQKEPKSRKIIQGLGYSKNTVRISRRLDKSA